MKTFLGIVLLILGLGSIITMFTPLGAGVVMFWKVAHVVAGIVLIVAAVPMLRSLTSFPDTAGYRTPRI